MRNYIHLILALVSLFVIVNLGLIYFYSGAQSFGMFIMPSFIDDDLYYYARVNEVLGGNYLIGNPYFYEHSKTMAPAFFLPDLIYSIPSFIFGSINYAIFFNILFWSLLFSFLTHYLLKNLNLRTEVSFWATIFIFISFYVLLFRPVSTQISLVAFVLFLNQFLKWLKSSNQLNDKVFFWLTVVFSIYIYQYLAQVVVATLILSFPYFLVKKNYSKVRELLFLGAAWTVALLPLVYLSFKQIKLSFYWETMGRIGLVDSYLITPKSIYFSLLVLSLILIYKYFKDVHLSEFGTEDKNGVFILISGSALIVALLSNFITGKELEMASHIGGLFVSYWLFIGIVVLCNSLPIFYKRIDINYFKKLVFLLPIFLILFLEIIPRFYSSAVFAFNTINRPEYIKEIQGYVGLKKWFNEHEGDNGFVVFSDEGNAYYLTTFSNGYVVSSPHGILHLLSNQESLERYLVSQYPKEISLESIKKNFRKYLGAGVLHRYNDYNKKVRLCRLLYLEKFGYSCGEVTSDPTQMVDEKLFQDAHDKYTSDIKPNIYDYLTKYQVKYFLYDKKSDVLLPLKDMKEVYQDNAFILYNFGGNKVSK